MHSGMHYTTIDHEGRNILSVDIKILSRYVHFDTLLQLVGFKLI
jgi:hypothetical protein